MEIKTPWAERKQAYLAHLVSSHSDVLMVSGCDKLHNARAILEDLMSVGLGVFDRFTAKKEGTLWYYSELSRVFTDLEAPMALELATTVGAILELAESTSSLPPQSSRD